MACARALQPDFSFSATMPVPQPLFTTYSNLTSQHPCVNTFAV
jgi:hypothetical protein